MNTHETKIIQEYTGDNKLLNQLELEHMAMVIEMKEQEMTTRGGARIGAGRPIGTGKYGEPTIPIRLPVSLKAEYDKWIKSMTVKKAVADFAYIDNEWSKVEGVEGYLVNKHGQVRAERRDKPRVC